MMPYNMQAADFNIKGVQHYACTPLLLCNFLLKQFHEIVFLMFLISFVILFNQLNTAGIFLLTHFNLVVYINGLGNHYTYDQKNHYCYHNLFSFLF